jgi:hypothetical protein
MKVETYDWKVKYFEECRAATIISRVIKRTAFISKSAGDDAHSQPQTIDLAENRRRVDRRTARHSGFRR